MLAHNAEGRTSAESSLVESQRLLLQEWNEQKWNARREEWSTVSKTPQRVTKSKSAFIGQKKGLVLLVEFADCYMTYSQSDFDEMFNQVGYSKYDHIGSVHDYFNDQSYGMFDWTFDVVGPLRMPEEMKYYGRNNDAKGQTDVHIGELVIEACRQADEYVNFADYDWDGDGEVEEIFVVYAGYGEAQGAPSYTIWPHKFSLTGCQAWSDGDGPLTLDGTKIDVYACSCELAGTRGETINGIGTACHEFSHCFGLPDIYDVNYTGGVGMQKWDLMNSGSYNGPNQNGEVPTGYSAYERQFVGWLDFIELEDITRIKDVPSLTDSPTAYVIYNDLYPDEYFVLENRQNNRWFEYVGGSRNCHGLFVTHVDYDEKSWLANNVNIRRAHQRLSWVPADGNYGYYYMSSDGYNTYSPTDEDYEGDMFPGSQGVTEITENSHSAVGGKWFNATSTGYTFKKTITNIKEVDGLISFDFMGGLYVDTPILNEANLIGPNQIELTWQETGPADSYEVEVIENRKIPTSYIRLNESFKTLLAAAEDEDGTTDISRYINSFTDASGWTASNIFTSKNGARVGRNDGSEGWLLSQEFFIGQNALTVQISYSFPEGNVVPLEISWISREGEEINVMSLPNIKDGDTATEWVTIPEAQYVSLRISTMGVAYVSGIKCYDGKFTADELTNESILAAITNPIESYSFSDLTENYCELSGLNAKYYKARVRAVYDEAKSEWTDYIDIDLSEYNSVSTIETDLEEPIAIYNLMGQRVYEPLRPGVYIFDYGTHRNKKAIR
ncbi:MAG: M6 family metalloprotease domain-containing protein [Bacteroidales bacterium]|nr:M6 family metalloprotease domain-containing protein [Bacteroidales bacterium]